MSEPSNLSSVADITTEMNSWLNLQLYMLKQQTLALL